ncbi:MAG: hypothetical protein J3R72DRAFT_440849, partial [Linnemannia gamsii]
MLARLLLTLVILTSLVVSEQTPLTGSAGGNGYTFKVINYSKSRGGEERVSPTYQGPRTVRSPYIYRNTTWSKNLDDAKMAAVKAVAPFTWRDSTDSSNVYMWFDMPSDMKGYFAFSTDWHILSGYLSNRTSSEEFVTAIVPISLENGSVNGLMDFILV